MPPDQYSTVRSTGRWYDPEASGTGLVPCAVGAAPGSRGQELSPYADALAVRFSGEAIQFLRGSRPVLADCSEGESARAQIGNQARRGLHCLPLRLPRRRFVPVVHDDDGRLPTRAS